MSTRSRLLVTALGTVWVVSCVIGYLAFGHTFANPIDAQYWYGLGWMLAGAVAVCPFIIYETTGVKRDNSGSCDCY